MGRQTVPDWCMCVIHLLPCPVGFPFLRTAALGVVKGPGQEATGSLSQVYYSYYLHYDLLRQLSPLFHSCCLSGQADGAHVKDQKAGIGILGTGP